MVQLGVSIGIFGEVELHTEFEGLRSDIFVHLLQEAAALAIGNTIEEFFGFDGVFGLGGNRMRGGSLVRTDAPLLVLDQIQPGLIFDILVGVLAQTGHKCGERLVEPEVIPPNHSDQVAEPLMRDFVHDHVLEPEFPGPCGLCLEQNHFGIGDAPHVFHGAEVILRADNVVHFLVRILSVHEFRVEADRVVLNTEKFFCVFLRQVFLE